MQDTTARRMLANKKLVDDREGASFQEIINCIENYIQLMTKRKCSALDDALVSLENLESDLVSIIDDVKECIEGRV